MPSASFRLKDVWECLRDILPARNEVLRELNEMKKRQKNFWRR